ncbi:hypothetical protein MFIFM68171_00843 [Madurella fahalii]|uniref:Uncharacterized protein n=1 Tax=Madurella fahalii TaxID=1157608 RepID=A0ABQ0FYR4_9PEZI
MGASTQTLVAVYNCVGAVYSGPVILKGKIRVAMDVVRVKLTNKPVREDMPSRTPSGSTTKLPSGGDGAYCTRIQNSWRDAS